MSAPEVSADSGEGDQHLISIASFTTSCVTPTSSVLPIRNPGLNAASALKSFAKACRKCLRNQLRLNFIYMCTGLRQFISFVSRQVQVFRVLCFLGWAC